MATPLDEYVAQPDPHYQWTLHSTTNRGFYRYHVLELQSQGWRAPHEVDQTIWRHWLTIIEPGMVRSDQVLLQIRGGHNDAPAPEQPDLMQVQVAQQTGSLIAELYMVPNQHLRFADEEDERYLEKGRREDQLVAYTWDKYLHTHDPEWLARLPMTKAVVRAMDAIQEFGQNLERPRDLNGFVLVGASKRGWTAWNVAAVDQRVTAMASLVIDLLNLKQSMTHHHCAYGTFSPALCDYVEMGIPDWWQTKPFDDLLEIVEPFNYRERLTMPKLIINATGDDFFLPDSSRFYFGELLGPKHLRYIPNTNHSLQGSNAALTIAAFYDAVISNHPLPTCDWRLDAAGLLEVTTDQSPLQVKLWKAENREARDFRLSQIGAAWSEELLMPESDGIYRIQTGEPSEGWAAYLVELSYLTPSGLPFVTTTDVFVLPETLPYQLPEN